MNGSGAKSEIQYIRPDAPRPAESRRRGIRSEAWTPATLDLADRARLAVNGLTEPTNPEADYRVYWKTSFRFNPPVMYHDFSDTGIGLKFLEAVPRMRIMCGSVQNLHVEQRWQEALLKMVTPDGLVATPLVGPGCVRPSSDAPQGDQLVDLQVNGLATGVAATYALLGDSDFWEPVGRGIVDGLHRLAVVTGDMAYFPQSLCAPGAGVDPSAPRPRGGSAASSTWPARRLIDFYRATGYKPALELAGKLCRYLPTGSQYFGPNYEFLPDDPDPEGPRHHVIHFHTHAMTILTCLEYGLVAADQPLLDFALGAFPVARTYGERLTGYFPESVNLQWPQTHVARGQTCELCEVGDMVRIALRLAETGLGDAYWDDADMWLRNQLAEGQFLRHDWIYRLHYGDPPSRIGPDVAFGIVEEGGGGVSAERVGTRNVGAFAGWQSPNDWVEFERRAGGGYNGHRGYVQGIMHCCTANAVRALYDAWRNVVHTQGERVKVNLLLNHTHETVDIDSHIPYVGQVDLHVKRDCLLSVRLPAWVPLGQVNCVVGESPRAVTFDGRYAQVGQVQANQTVELTFPISERTDCIYLNDRLYYLVRKGHEVVCIDPPGKLCPLYQRDHYRENVTLWKKTTRYLDEQRLDW